MKLDRLTAALAALALASLCCRATRLGTASARPIITLLFNANKTTGKGGFVPTAAQLAAVLSYRVIAAP